MSTSGSSSGESLRPAPWRAMATSCLAITTLGSLGGLRRSFCTSFTAWSVTWNGSK
jgi:hypothetical protein